MSTTFLRVHSATDHFERETTVLGMSLSASDLASAPQFEDFLGRHKIESHPLPRGLAPQGGVSARYFELHPRLNDGQLHELGAICVGGTYDGVRYPGVMDFDDAAYVLDNRSVEPGRDSPDNIIARG